MHFSTLDDSDDDQPPSDLNILHSSNNSQPRSPHSNNSRRASTSTHQIHDQIRLGLLPQNAQHPRSYSISLKENSARRKSTCFIFCAGSVTTVAITAMAVAIFLIIATTNGNGASGGNNPGVVTGLETQTIGPSSMNVKWSYPTNITIDSFQLQMVPLSLLPFATNDTDSDIIMNDDGLSCRTQILNLNASTYYCFRIRALLNGMGSWSTKQCNITKTAQRPEPPNSPTVFDLSTNSTSDRLHVGVAPPLNQGGATVHTMKLYIDLKYHSNISIDHTTNHRNIAKTRLNLNKKKRGDLILLTTSACNNYGCSDLSNSLRCVVAKTADGHHDPIALCSECTVGGSAGGNDIILPPEHVSARSGASDTSSIISWDLGSPGNSNNNIGECAANRPSGFQLQRSDFWTQKNLEKGPIFNITADPYLNSIGGYTTDLHGLLPAATYEIKMRSMLLHSDGVVTYSKWNEASILKMNDAGACGNTMDIMIQRNKFNELVKDIQKCMLQCIVSGESCVVDCVSKNVGLSRPCSACWGEEGQCVEKHCSILCLKDPTGNECLQCTNENCMPALEECTGLPRYTFPNPRG